MSFFAKREHGHCRHEVITKVANAQLHIVIYGERKNSRQGGNRKGILISKKE
jgi:hypothetical protein